MPSKIHMLMAEKGRLVAKGAWKKAADKSLELADAFKQKRDLDAAITEFIEVAQWCAGDQGGAAALDIKLGTLAWRSAAELAIDARNYKDAIRFSKQYLNSSQTLNEGLEIQRALTTVGRAYQSYADALLLEDDPTEANIQSVKADEWHKRAFGAIQSIDRSQVTDEKEIPSMKCVCLYNRYLTRMQMTDTDNEENSMKKSRLLKELESLSGRYDLPHWKLRVCLEKASLALESRKYQQAKEMSQMALAVLAKDKNVDRDLEAEAWFLRAKACLGDKCFIEAKKHLLTAKKLVKNEENESITKFLKCTKKAVKKITALEQSQNSTEQSELHEKVADIFSDCSYPDLALFHYQKSFDKAIEANLSRKKQAVLAFSIADSNIDLGNFDEAIVYFKKELELSQGQENFKTILTWQGLLKCMAKANKPYEVIRTEAEKALEFAVTFEKESWHEHVILTELVNIQKQYDKTSDSNETLKRIKDLIERKGEPTEPEEDSQPVSDSSSSEDEDDENELGRRQTYVVKKNKVGETTLHLYCKEPGKEEEILRLIKEGHPVNIKDKFNYNPIHEAANFGFVNYVKILIEAGANMNVKGGEHENSNAGMTPLVDACINGHLEVIEVLLNAGAQVQIQDATGWTAYDILKFQKERQLFDEEVIPKVEVLLKKMKEALKKVQESGQKIYVLPKEKHSCLLGTENESDALTEVTARYSSNSPIRCQNRQSGRRIITTGAKDYANAISSMGSHSTPSAAVALGMNTKRPKKQPAIVVEENVIDDWLIDDVGDNGRVKRKRSRQNGSVSMANESKKSKQAVDSNLESDDQDDVPEVVEDPPGAIEYEEPLETSTQISVPPIPTQPKETSAPVKKNTIKISVKDRLLLVPIHFGRGQTVQTLENEVAKRYNVLTGIELVCRLKTSDGAELLPNDEIDSILTGDETLVAHIVRMDSAKVEETYAKLCSTAKAKQYKNIFNALSESRKTQRLRISCALQPTDAGIIFEALKACPSTNLTEIALPKNKLGDKSIDSLCQAMSEMGTVEKIDLSNNGLTYHCLNALREVILNCPVRCLNLSFNPLGDSSQSFVMFCLTNKVRQIKVNCCRLTQKFLINPDLISSINSDCDVEEFSVQLNSFPNEILTKFQESVEDKLVIRL